MPFVTYAQNSEDLMLYRALKDETSGFYIDVGAAEPNSHSVTRAFYERGWSGVNVEPNPWFFARLQAARPRDVNLQVAVSDSSGSATFYFVGENTGLSTLDRPLADWHRSQGQVILEAEIPALTLARICEDHVGDKTVHFLKLDVEGAELLALRGHDFSRWRPWIIVGEAHDAERTNEGWKAWADLHITNEYRFEYNDGLNRFYIAAEHHDRLARAFEVPPNVYDDWITSFASKTHQKSGAFPPPAFPSFGGTTPLSDFRADRCLAAPLRPLPSPHADLPRLRAPLSRRAVPSTPVDRFGCICRLLPQTVLPSPNSGRVGVRNFSFEACSGFTHVTARRFAPPPKARFVAGLRRARLPNHAACQLPGKPTIARVGLPPTR
jgi:FkbM family methyltransferase